MNGTTDSPQISKEYVGARRIHQSLKFGCSSRRDKSLVDIVQFYSHSQPFDMIAILPPSHLSDCKKEIQGKRENSS